MRKSTLPSVALSASLIVGLIPFGTAAQDPLEGVPTGTLTERIGNAIVADAATLAGDPEASRRYVTARVGYEDYEGVLKGAVGAYLTGSANGADQALLLSELLGPSIETRFAVCAPGEALASELASQAATTSAGRGLALDHLTEVQAQIDEPELSAAVAEVLELRSGLKLEAAQDADRLSNELYEAGYLGVSQGDAAPTTHVWLQAQVDADWIDLDTTSTDGAARCAVEGTHEELPETLGHVVRFVVRAEQRSDGVLETSELMAADFPIADLAAARVTLLFGEPAGLVEESDPTSGGARYTPVLRIDGESMPAIGSIELPRPAEGLGGGLSDTVEGLGGLFESLPSTTDEEPEEEVEDVGGGLFGGGGDDGGLFGEIGLPTADEGPQPTAMWLDVELLAPDGEVIETRTELFDRIGVAARADGNGLTTELAPLDEVAGEYAPMSTIWQIGLLVGEATAAEAVQVEPLDPSSIDSYAAQIDAQLRTFPAIHRDMGGAGRVPALLTAAAGPALDADGQAISRLTFDALHVPSRAPVDDRAAALDAHAIMAAERMLAAVSGDAAGSAGDSAAVLRQAWEEGIELVSLAPGDPNHEVSASPEALARMQARLDAGYSLLVPGTPPTVDGVKATAWWTIDPASGTVRDEHESGGHAETTEYSVNTSQSITTMERLRRFGCRIAKPAATAALVLFLATGAGAGSPLYEPLSEVVEAAAAAREAEAGREAAEQAACALG